MNKILLFILLVFISCRNLRKVEDWNFEAFHNEIVARHNELRKKHASSSLTILKDLSTLCQKAVDHCKKIGDLEHVFVQLDNGTYVGQNLYLSSWAPTGTQVANAWYSENEDYDYENGKPKPNKITGHFTQLVWKSSKHIGCAYAVGPWGGYSNGYYIGCDYFPAGNYAGEFLKNVSPPTS